MQRNCESEFVESSTSVEEILQSWGFQDLIPDFADKGIDFQVLKNITADDLNKLIPDKKFGLRIKFRTKLFEWRSLNGCSAIGDTITLPLDSWLNSTTEVQSVSNLSSPSSRSLNEFSLDLNYLLNSSLNGRGIHENYKQFGYLGKSDRQKLCSIIAEYWINNHQRVLNSHYTEAAAKIKSLFPREEVETYLGTRTHRGKLAERYYTLCKQYRSSGLISSRYNLKRKASEDNQINENIALETPDYEKIPANCKADFEWLQNNNGPELLVISKWETSYPIRHLDYFSQRNILEKWPILKQKVGAQLIQLDFEKKFPGKSSLLFSKWKPFYEKTSPILRREIRDPANKKLLHYLDDESEDTRNFIFISLINALLVPQLIKSKGTRRQWKPTIADSQKSFAIHVTDENYILSTTNQKKSDCIARGTTMQPLIIAIGEDVKKLTAFYVCFNDILYDAETMLKAISLTFQLHQIFSIEYAKECTQLWLLCEYLYEMPISAEKSSDLNALLGNLKN